MKRLNVGGGQPGSCMCALKLQVMKRIEGISFLGEGEENRCGRAGVEEDNGGTETSIKQRCWNIWRVTSPFDIKVSGGKRVGWKWRILTEYWYPRIFDLGDRS